MLWQIHALELDECESYKFGVTEITYIVYSTSYIASNSEHDVNMRTTIYDG